MAAVLWDMDGTLIDSEPYWHESEYELARIHGGEWNERLAWSGSGTPVIEVARTMVAHGVALSPDEIVTRLVADVAGREEARMPWIPGVRDVLESLVRSGIPSVLVTASPRAMAEHLVDQAPRGAFAGYICGEDSLPSKPDPAPYRAAAALLDVGHDDIVRCIAIEDSATGLQSAADSGATTIAQEGFTAKPSPDGPQFATINGYGGIDVATLDEYVRRRMANMSA